MAAGEYPLAVNSALQRFTISNPDINANGIVSTVINPLDTKKGKFLEIIFDIDIFKNTEKENTWEVINENISDLRNIKNDLFEANITDKARRLFNE